MLYFAHVFFADHILNTTWTVYFAVLWWLHTPHDGRRNANSPAQQALIDGYIGKHQDMSPDERAAAAERVWRAEKAQALTIIILGWLIKVRIIAVLSPSMTHLLIISSTLPPSYTHLRTISAAVATVHFPVPVPPAPPQHQPTPRSRTNSQRFLRPTRITGATTISRRTSTWNPSTHRRPPLSTTATAAVRRLPLRTAVEALAQGAQARSRISSVRHRPSGHGLRVGAYLLVAVVMVRGGLGVARGAVVLGRVKARTTR